MGSQRCICRLLKDYADTVWDTDPTPSDQVYQPPIVTNNGAWPADTTAMAKKSQNSAAFLNEDTREDDERHCILAQAFDEISDHRNRYDANNKVPEVS